MCRLPAPIAACLNDFVSDVFPEIRKRNNIRALMPNLSSAHLLRYGEASCNIDYYTSASCLSILVVIVGRSEMPST
ncbi:unnamed protein product [Clonostachys solani]|uniref:Uncharacterized protein n=1 Tax=Clonostachys solani TaxID=160281 RepID=A0A9N9ZB48_9HYPO|nr:unnamed protein product [Clonostachys solani]